MTIPGHVPELTLPQRPTSWSSHGEPDAWPWREVAPLPPFLLADGSGPARQQTVARVCADQAALYTRFDCTDTHIWGTYVRRDDPIYDEEVVEVFLGPGRDDPLRYFEFEVSPNGVLLDAAIYNPSSRRPDMQVDFSWDCPGLQWRAGRDDAAHRWWAVLVIPWAAVSPPGGRPATWRANFYRIDRPQEGEPEFSCWSPTMTDPADFHKPPCFGVMNLE